ncbi:MAG: hypothetical protein Q4D39_00825 [Coriobacteriaceae bacterium]|nr:hypothetical protein [Coriobacteriaceae bacterium]
MGICFCTVFALSIRSCASEAGIDLEESDVADETVRTEDSGRSTELVISQQPLEREAEDRLVSYRNEEGCTLECAGYLDLFGNAWGCVVQGDGWVEIVVIRTVAEEACSVQTIRLSAGG